MRSRRCILRLALFYTVLGWLATATVHAHTVTPRLRMQLQQQAASQLAPGTANADIAATRIPVWIQGDPALVPFLPEQAEIQRAMPDGSVRVGARLQAAEIRQLMQDTQSWDLQLDKPLSYRPLLDVATEIIGQDQVLSPTGGVPVADGLGSVVVIIDTGMDVTHPTFRNPDGSTRIIRYWDMTVDGNRYTDGLPIGTECNSSDINLGQCNLDDEDATRTGIFGFGHGTHVAGIAAGSDADYGGVAPAANIIGIKAFFDEVALIGALEYAYALHKAWQRPFVVNLSLGSNEGPHDGTTDIEQWILGHSSPGFIVVAAAGNESVDNPEYSGGIHAAITRPTGLDAGGAAWYMAGSLQVKTAIAAMYHDGKQPGDLVLTRLDSLGQPVGTAQQFNSTELAAGVDTDLGNDIRLLAVAGYDETFDRTEYALVVSGYNDSDITGARIAILLEDVERADIWATDRLGSFLPYSHTIQANGVDAWLGPGNNESTITNPGTGERVLTIGSFIGRTTWPADTGVYGNTDVQTGDLSAISSHGPTRDQRRKPDLVAPGQYVVSARSSNLATIPDSIAVGDGMFMVQFGTSMAAPMAAGAVALMLQKNPLLGFTDIRDLLYESAGDAALRNPPALPNNLYGAGTLDLGALFASSDWWQADPDTSAPVIQLAQLQVEDGQWTLRAYVSEPAQLTLRTHFEDATVDNTRESYDTIHTWHIDDPGEPESLRLLATDFVGNTSLAWDLTTAVAGCGCSIHPGVYKIEMLYNFALAILAALVARYFLLRLE